MCYLVPAATATAEIEIKKSRFIAYSFPVEARSTALEHVASLKAQYPDARHHCWAYQIGNPQHASAAMDDDGEPGGTAGKPILSRIQHSGLSDVLVIVVRYFGGIKLGAGGLVRAYGQAAGEVLAITPRARKINLIPYLLHGPYEAEHPLRQWCDQAGATVKAFRYTASGFEAELHVPHAHTTQLEQRCHQWKCRLRTQADAR